MGGRFLTDMAAVLRSAGLSVIEQSGWQSRARNSGGYGSAGPLCVMWHHTASGANSTAKGDTDYMSFGSDNRPVANIMIARNGDVWVLAAGCTNTNGKGDSRRYSRGTVPANSMNSHAIGMEIQNTGLGEAYSVQCINAAFAASNALNRAYGNQPEDVDTHVAYAPGRKIDPATANAVQGPWRPRSINGSGSWNVDDLRAECRRRSGTVPPPVSTPDDEEFDVAFIIVNQDTGQPAVVYGEGLLTGIDGGAYNTFVSKFGPAITVEGATFADFEGKSNALLGR